RSACPSAPTTSCARRTAGGSTTPTSRVAYRSSATSCTATSTRCRRPSPAPPGNTRAETLSDAQVAAREAIAALPAEALDPAQPALFAADTMWPIFTRLRDEDPVHFTDSPTYGQFWSVTRWADILAIDSDHETFSSADGTSLLKAEGERARGAPKDRASSA